jgi:hypothetical protein
MAESRYLLGRGELLTELVSAPKRRMNKRPVYSFAEAKEMVQPQIKKAASNFDKLSSKACPGEFVVGQLTLNPAYIAKSYFPEKFLEAANLRSIGSKNVRITPKKWSKKGDPKECETTTLFITGRRDAFRSLPQVVNSFKSQSSEADQFSEIEAFHDYAPAEKLRRVEDNSSEVYEVALQLIPGGDNKAIVKSFISYVQSIEGKVNEDLQFFVSSLWFAPVVIPKKQLLKLAEFSFVRVVRPMPSLRGLRPVMRSSSVSLDVALPNTDALSLEPRVAILDGGLPDEHPIGRWVKRYELMDSSQKSSSLGEEHGLGVTSAFLFGPLQSGVTAPRPFSQISHFRVLDEGIQNEDPLELYRTLGFVEAILLSRQYQFINLSLGPDLPIEDNDVHAWTSLIDSLLDDGDTLLTVAAGNNGEQDRASGNARIQVPADCVNALSVGACDILPENGWSRASYSALGPGRRPGVVKPDLVTFGGSRSEYFHHLGPGSKPAVKPNLGTSFASPYLLRTAVGARAILGPDLSPLGIKALLVHCAQSNGHPTSEIGWGRIPTTLSPIINCQDGMVRVIYQGQLLPGKYLRAKVPVPTYKIEGRVNLKATFCYACPTDPQDAAAYTKAGLEVVFRPDANIKVPKGKQPKSRSFFDMGRYSSEAERRSDFGKWETVIHDEDRMLGSTLKAPAFDIHYNAREGGGTTTAAKPIKYALIITIEAARHASIYEDVLRAYSNVLVPLQPQIPLPVSV